MSTRSHIAIPTFAGIKSIYCHSDGYPACTGYILDTHYRDPQKVRDLLHLGNLSLLNKDLHPNPEQPHSFEYKQRQPGVTVAYGRDRGETGQDAEEHASYDDWHASMWPFIDYAYVFVGGTWLCAEITDPEKNTLVFQHVKSMINPEHVKRIFGDSDYLGYSNGADL